MVDLQLKPIINSFTQLILNQHKTLLFNLTAALGSPLNIIFPDLVQQNIRAFKQVLNNSGVEYAIFYAHKANKSSAILEACAKNQLSIDVASIGEFCHALQHGFTGAAIGVSGPMKHEKLLLLALQHQALIQIDSLQELELLISISQKLKSQPPARILLRVAPTENTRFGLFTSEIISSLDFLQKHSQLIDLQGFSFHISGYALSERAHMLMQLIELIKLARAKGWAAKIIDIGGGIPISYVDQASWESFLDQNNPDLFHAQRSFTNFYPYHSGLSGSEFLHSLLNWPEPTTAKTIAQLLQDESIKLLLEPGRSLLDQAGLSIFKVRGLKARGDYAIASVDGTSFSISEQWFNSEFLPNPIHLSAQSNPKPQTSRTCVGGASCLESDVISWRKIDFAAPLLAGDLLVYTNTAGYQMDSNESEFHLLPIPQKIALYQTHNNEIQWKTDGEFSQLDMKDSVC